MLISALNDYYDILSADGKVAENGFCFFDVTHMIMLKPDGRLADIIDVRRTVKISKDKERLVQKTICLPERTQKPGIDFNIAEHRPLYIFGLNRDSKTGKFTDEDKTCKAQKSHDCFVKGTLEYTEGMTSEIVTALRNFCNRWNPKDETENVLLAQLGKDYDTAKCCFALDGHPELLVSDSKGEIAQKVRRSQNKDSVPDGICAVTGKKDTIARLHNKIKGVRGAQASGGSMVCFNNSAEESYGKEQSYNSSVSETVMKRYTTSLNTLLADENHRIYLDDMTIVFWSVNKFDGKENDIFKEVMGEASDDGSDNMDIGNTIKNAVNALCLGKTIDYDAVDIDENTDFYVVGLSPNVSRISECFICRKKFDKIFTNTLQHQVDMMLDEEYKQISMWRLFKELKLENSSKEKVPQAIISATFTAILNGTKYPDILFSSAVRRVKADRKVNYIKAGIIKACLNRKMRINKGKEEIGMALDINNKNQAYLCGRLFAVLERIQKNASNNTLNRTIKDSYFSSACSNPSSVFPKLLKTAQYHLRKDKYAKANEKTVREIINGLNNEFPQMLPLNEQGKFIIGYYQQVKERKNENESTEEQV